MIGHNWFFQNLTILRQWISISFRRMRSFCSSSFFQIVDFFSFPLRANVVFFCWCLLEYLNRQKHKVKLNETLYHLRLGTESVCVDGFWKWWRCYTINFCHHSQFMIVIVFAKAAFSVSKLNDIWSLEKMTSKELCCIPNLLFSIVFLSFIPFTFFIVVNSFVGDPVYA